MVGGYRPFLTLPYTWPAGAAIGDILADALYKPDPRVRRRGVYRVRTEVTPRPASVWITSPVMMRDWDEASIT